MQKWEVFLLFDDCGFKIQLYIQSKLSYKNIEWIIVDDSINNNIKSLIKNYIVKTKLLSLYRYALSYITFFLFENILII